MLVGLAVVSLLQDAAWFTLNRDLDDEDEEDGGVERGVRGFSRKMSYLSFALRVSIHTSLHLICAWLADFLFFFVLYRYC